VPDSSRKMPMYSTFWMKICRYTTLNCLGLGNVHSDYYFWRTFGKFEPENYYFSKNFNYTNNLSLGK
jgi:hypothetical protein